MCVNVLFPRNLHFSSISSKNYLSWLYFQKEFAFKVIKKLTQIFPQLSSSNYYLKWKYSHFHYQNNFSSSMAVSSPIPFVYSTFTTSLHTFETSFSVPLAIPNLVGPKKRRPSWDITTVYTSRLESINRELLLIVSSKNKKKKEKSLSSESSRWQVKKLEKKMLLHTM